MPRTPPPNRRPSVNLETPFGSVSVGLDISSGLPLDVFADGPREGSDLQHILSDACVVISLAVQHGATPEELLKSTGTMPWIRDGRVDTVPASVIGWILLAMIEAKNG